MSGGGHGPYTPTFAIYEPKTGICTLTIKEHDFFSGASTYSGDITGALYNAPSGILTVTTNSDPGWATGDLVKFDNGSLSFKCAMDGNTATKTYPRSTDPASRSWKKVTKVDPTNYSLNVGASTFLNHLRLNTVLILVSQLLLSVIIHCQQVQVLGWQKHLLSLFVLKMVLVQ